MDTKSSFGQYKAESSLVRFIAKYIYPLTWRVHSWVSRLAQDELFAGQGIAAGMEQIALPPAQVISFASHRKNRSAKMALVPQCESKREHQKSHTEVEQLKHDLRAPITALESVIDFSGFKDGVSILRLNPDEARLLLLATRRLSSIVSPNPNANFNVHKGLMEVIEEKRLFLQKGQWPVQIEVQDLSNGKVQTKAPLESLQRVLSNILNNSIEANASKITVKIECNFITVIDNGVGIPDEVMEKLGRERVSAGKGNFTNGSGQGLGALGAADVLGAVGGSVYFSKRPSGGTEVLLNLG